MAVGLNKTFLVLSLPIISIVSLYLYCRRQSKNSANSDQVREDLCKIQPEAKGSEDKPTNDLDQYNSVSTTNSNEMQLISNQSTNAKMAADKPSNKDSKFVKMQRSSSSNGTVNGDKTNKRSNESTVQNVENNLNALSLNANDNNLNKSNDSSKTLTFAQVLETKNLVKQQTANDANSSTTSGSASTSDNKSNKTRESSTDQRKQDNKPKSDKVNENGIRNKHWNLNGKSKKNEKNEQTLNNDRANNVKNNSENVSSKSNESKLSQEASSSNKPINCASDSIVNHNRVEKESKDTAHSSNNWNKKSTNKVPTKQPLIDTPPQINLPSSSSSVCPATTAGDSSELLLNNKSELKRLNDSQAQQSPFSDVYSENSSDSGKGSSENRNETPLNPALIATPPIQQFATVQFQFPQNLVRMIIGRQHQTIDLLRSQSGANVLIHTNNFDHNAILSISGRSDQIDRFLSLLHQRFPIENHPYFDLQNQIQYAPIPSPIFPSNFNMSVPMSGICDVILSSMTNAGTLFLVQPTHPLYASFRNMWADLNETYNTFNTPLLQAFQQGIICVAKVQNQWNRAMIFDWIDENNYWIRLVDSGELVQANVSSLRQISPNYMNLPFQACECILNGIQPVDPEVGWSEEANAFVYEFLKGYILKARLIGQTDRGTSLIELFKLNGEKSTMLNSHLVNNGFAKYIQFS